jgi:hypothetical protein
LAARSPHVLSSTARKVSAVATDGREGSLYLRKQLLCPRSISSRQFKCCGGSEDVCGAVTAAKSVINLSRLVEITLGHLKVALKTGNFAKI